MDSRGGNRFTTIPQDVRFQLLEVLVSTPATGGTQPPAQILEKSHASPAAKAVARDVLRLNAFLASNCLEVFRGYLVKRIVCPKSSIVLNFANLENLFVAGRDIICGKHEQKMKELYTPVKDAHSFHHPRHGGDV